MPAPVRLTYLGLTSIPKPMLEAGESFGATKRQLLWKVELPLASSVILAERVDALARRLSPSQQVERPYAFNSAEIFPVSRPEYRPTDVLSVVFFVYNLSVDATNLPDVTVQYTFRQMSRLGRVFGGGNGNGNPRGGQGGPSVWMLLGGALLLWLAVDAWSMIDERQRGVVLRFGKFDRIMGSGLSFKWPRPIEEVYVVEAARVRSTDSAVELLPVPAITGRRPPTRWMSTRHSSQSPFRAVPAKSTVRLAVTSGSGGSWR